MLQFEGASYIFHFLWAHTTKPKEYKKVEQKQKKNHNEIIEKTE